jgi:hypothetical protein
MAFSPDIRLPLIPFIRGLISTLRFLACLPVPSPKHVFYSLIQPAEHDAVKTEKRATTRRDLLALLIRANMATGLHSIERMSDDEMVARNYPFYCLRKEGTELLPF